MKEKKYKYYYIKPLSIKFTTCFPTKEQVIKKMDSRWDFTEYFMEQLVEYLSDAYTRGFYDGTDLNKVIHCDYDGEMIYDIIESKASKYYGKVLAGEDNPMVSLKEIKNIIEKI